MIEKPHYGEPCNGCGLCCESSPCPLGQILFHQKTGPCPALERAGEKRICGLIVTPIAYNMAAVLKFGNGMVSEAAALLVGAAQGCDTQEHGEIVNPAAIEKLFASARALNRESISRAKYIWGINA